MKKALFPISLFLLLISIALLAGCSKDSTSSNNNPPNAPSNMTASQTDRHFVALSWGVSNADTVLVQESTDSSTWSNVAFLSGNATSLNDSSINADKHYFFRARAQNANGQSDYSNVTSIWTLPAVYDFSTADQLNNFTVTGLEGAPAPDWTEDNGAGKITLTEAGPDSASLLTDYTMQNTGWFESKLKVAQWHGTGDNASYANFFVERAPGDVTNNIVGVFFSADSTILGYYSSGGAEGLNRVATNPTLPTLSSNAWHTIRLFHQAAHWDLYIDGVRVWSGDIVNVAGTGELHQEWQFTGGNGPANQVFWVDDIANPSPTPAAVNFVPQHTLDNSLNTRALPKKK